MKKPFSVGSPAASGSDEGVNFSSATRAVLFGRKGQQEIPGAGRSAAELPERHVRVKVTINLDGDVVQHFKERALKEGVPYQTLINQVLRTWVEGSRPQHLAREVKQLLLEDEEFMSQIKSRTFTDNGE